MTLSSASLSPSTSPTRQPGSPIGTNGANGESDPTSMIKGLDYASPAIIASHLTDPTLIAEPGLIPLPPDIKAANISSKVHDDAYMQLSGAQVRN